MSLRICAIIPSYNHIRYIGDIVSRLRDLGLPVFVVDDGSNATSAAALAALHDLGRDVRVTRLLVNRGKGGAVREGFRIAREANFTHVLQVDADGQHDLAAVPRMLEIAERHPDALISGHAVHDQSAPRGRRIARWITHFWVFVETLSLQVTDSMCGLRIYPLESAEAVVIAEPVGNLMDFDIALMVRLCWRGVPVVMVPVGVSYPFGNTSNFRPWRDNLRITWMHTRLVFGMLARLIGGRIKRPRRPDTATHWASLTELGVSFGIRFCVVIYRLIGRHGCLLVMGPIVAWYYVTAGDRRRASRCFLERAFAAAGIDRRPSQLDGLRHFMQFAARTLDSFIAWTGGMRPDAVEPADPEALAAFTRDPRGGVLIVGHLGNTDVSRACLDPAVRARLLVLTHTTHAKNYNRILNEISPDAAVNVFQVTDIGPDTAISLRDHIDRGCWIVIAGDRTPVNTSGRVTHVPFLGAPAPFSQGPYVLAALMECPVWLLFCRKIGERYRLDVERFAERIVLPRGKREPALADYAARYAARLQAHTIADPFQWYNFYDFWAG
jgi:predicted LPLAT superfamily acyltransferase/glycosyltransferase involved in cell wall biosynthesis